MKFKNKRLKTTFKNCCEWILGVSSKQTDPATENVHSPTLVKVDGIVYVRISVEEHSPCRQDDAAVVLTISLM